MSKYRYECSCGVECSAEKEITHCFRCNKPAPGFKFLMEPGHEYEMFDAIKKSVETALYRNPAGQTIQEKNALRDLKFMVNLIETQRTAGTALCAAAGMLVSRMKIDNPELPGWCGAKTIEEYQLDLESAINEWFRVVKP